MMYFADNQIIKKTTIRETLNPYWKNYTGANLDVTKIDSPTPYVGGKKEYPESLESMLKEQKDMMRKHFTKPELEIELVKVDNLPDYEPPISIEELVRVAKEMQDIVYSEIEKYRAHFKDSEEGFLKNWPKNYTITVWIISMKSGGNLISHIHEYGWLSGSIYINVPPKVKVDSGNLVVGLDDQRQDSVKNTKSINVVTGSLCLFPSSLHHYTIPFEGEEERIVLAFDVLPD